MSDKNPVQQVLERVDQIEAASLLKLEAIKTEVATQIEASNAEVLEKFSALEAKVAAIPAPSVIRAPAKTVRGDVNRKVKEQLSKFAKSSGRMEQEVQLWDSADQHEAYLKEASSLTGGGDQKGGRTGYDPVFAALRLQNPMRGLVSATATDGSSYQFRSKIGNAGAAWGYAVNNNGSGTTQDTSIWQVVLADLNVQFPVRTAVLDDVDGLDSTIVDDMLAEFSSAEGNSMVQNNDQSGTTTTATGGTSGLRGLASYGGANGSYTGGTISTAAYGTSGTGATAGVHSLATYDQATTNAAAATNNTKYADLINFIHSLPQAYWGNSKWMVSPLFLAAVRGLVDSNGTPIFERMSPLETNGIVGKLLGFDVVVNNYVDSPYSVGTAATTKRYPAFFGDFNRGFKIVDRLSMTLKRYDQTTPGSIVFYGEKRLNSSVVDPNAIIRYRSTATGA